MKKITQLIVASLLLLLFATCGVNYTISTRIFPDGSCLRTMTARLDSSEYDENPFFIHIDTTWEESITMERDTSENKTYAVVKVQKKYPSVEAMNKEFYRKDSISEAPNLSIRFKKKFQWFYTKFRYEETYAQQFLFLHFPLSNYYTEQEIELCIYGDSHADSIFFAGKDSLERKKIENELEQKGDRFFVDNIFEEFYLELQSVIENSNDSFFANQHLTQIKSEMKELLRPFFLLASEESSDTSALQILSRFDKHYNTKAFTNVALTNPMAFETFDKKLNNDYMANGINDYEHTIYMPGTLINTNSHQFIEGNPNWKFDGDKFFFADYIMWAESRSTNAWALITTIALIVLSISMTLFRKRKK